MIKSYTLILAYFRKRKCIVRKD